MAKAKGSPGVSVDQQIEDLILDFLNNTPVQNLTSHFPINIEDVKHWYFSVHEWMVGDAVCQQSIGMVDEVARSFFMLVETVYMLSTKRDMKKGDLPISRKNVEAFMEGCVARYIWHSPNKTNTEAEDFVRTEIRGALLSPPRPHTVLVPVYGLFTNCPVEFRGVLYSRPKECSEYVNRMSKILDRNSLSIADAESDELNSGFDVIARVECRARFLDDAVHGAKEKVSRDLAILRYSAYREFRAASHLASPSVIKRERKPARLSTIVFDDQDSGTTQIAGFSISAEAPLNLQVWSDSKWSAAIASATTLSQAQGDSVAACLLDALTWLGRSTVQEDDATRLLFQITALEALLPVDGKEEKVHQISLQTTVLGGMTGLDRRDIYNLIRRAYTVRSEVVHGSRMTTSKYEPGRIGMLLDRIIDFLLFDEAGVGLLALSTDDFRNVLMEKVFE